jgi:hypothetical protein
VASFRCAAMRAGLLLLLLFPDPLSGQSFSGGFSFFLPPADSASTRFLPLFPRSSLTAEDVVGIDQDGHFAARGVPIRLFGANLVADGAFPTPAKASFIAGRLRKTGFNLVRFHHMDNPWSAASLFRQGQSTRQLNPLMLDRLENLLAELKKNGIYADINLHVSRTFNALDGLPDTDSLQEYGKAINYFDPAVLALHKEFARALLTHVSPYTSTSLVEDPVMAMVELTNENSLYRYWRDGKLRQSAEGGMLTARHVRMLDSLWIAFLARRYDSTAALARAWEGGAHPSDGLNRIINGTFELVGPSTGWVMEIQAPAAGLQRRDSLTCMSGKYSARVEVQSVDGTDWHVQWKQTGLSVTKDTTYIVTFAARADTSRTISVSLMRDSSPWTWYGGASFSLTPQWRRFSFTVRSPVTSTYGVRLSFTVGGAAGSCWFDDVGLTTVAVSGLRSDESLEAPLVRRIEYTECPAYTPARVGDMSSFYCELEENYYSAMRTFLRDSLHVRVPIAGTNFNIGPPDIAVQSKQDYVDNHSYWDHPSFPGVPWSSTDWTITNRPMVMETDGATVGQLFAGAPAAGKPFTVSEYNHPFPNRYQSEALLFFTAYGAFHGADGLMLFEYNSSDSWESDRIDNFFSIHRNPAMMALVPSCAAAYRWGMVSPSSETILLAYAPADYLTYPRRDNAGWIGWSLVDRRLALQHGVRASSFESPVPLDSSSLGPAPASPFVTDTKEITWDAGGLLSVATPRFAGAAGFLNAFSGRQAGPLTLAAANGFGSLTWISLTADSLRQARRSLLTVSSMAQNTGMVWDGTTTIHDNWGGAPTQVAPLLLTLVLNVSADSLRVYPLDPSGGETRGFSTCVPSGPNAFRLVIDQSQSQSMWFGIEAFGSGVPLSAPGEADRFRENSLAQNFPNPFNPATEIRYEVAGGTGGNLSAVRLTVYDLLGREVAVLVDARKAPGRYAATFDAGDLASGVYLCRMSVGGFVQVRKMICVK